MLSEKVSSDTLLDDYVAPDEALSLGDNDTSLKLNSIPDKKAAKDLAEDVTTVLSELSLQDVSATLLTSSLKDPAPSNPLTSPPPSPDNSELSFASPLAERHFLMYFYPDRRPDNGRDSKHVC